MAGIVLLKSQQKVAYDAILNHLGHGAPYQPQRFSLTAPNTKFYVLTGWAGTGKTFLLGELNKVLGRYGSVFVAPTNKATKVTANTIGAGATCKTIYALLGIKMVADEDRLVLKFPRIPVDLSAFDRIFVDESSMINEELLAYIIERSRFYQTKWVFIGDKGQIPPVGEEVSKVWTLDCAHSHLDDVVRYDNQILNFATRIRKMIQRYPRDLDLKLYSDHSVDDGVWKYKRSGFMKQVERAARKGLFSQIDHTKAIGWRNKTVNELNQRIRYAIFGEEADKHPYLVHDRLMIGEPVQVNGTVIAHIDDEGTIIEQTISYHSIYKDLNAYNVTFQIDQGPTVNLNILHPNSEAKFTRMLNVLADDAKKDNSKWKFFWMLKNSFHRVRYSYAITGHRSQGSTFRNVFLDTSDVLANSNSFEALRIMYVGSTRATTSLILV